HPDARPQDGVLGLRAAALRDSHNPVNSQRVGACLRGEPAQSRALPAARVGLVSVGVVQLPVQLHGPAGGDGPRRLHVERPARRPADRRAALRRPDGAAGVGRLRDGAAVGRAAAAEPAMTAPAPPGLLADTAAGGALGVPAGYLGGSTDNAINRVLDVFFSIPGLLLAVGIAALRGPGVNSAVLAIAIVYTPIFARVMRGPVLAERAKDYVEAVRALGATRLAVALKHILPNVISPFVVQGTVALSQAILIEASLSYLGLSAQPPTPSWGNML